MLNKLQTQRALQDFVNEVVKNSKADLQSKGKKASGDLIRSIKGDVKAYPNSIETTIYAEDYWEYVDKGVSGVKKKYQTPFKYTNKKPPVNVLQTWVKRKTGKFLGRDRKKIAFAIQNKIFNYGIEPTLFLTSNFEKAFESLPPELIEAYALDIEDFIEFTLKK